MRTFTSNFLIEFSVSIKTLRFLPLSNYSIALTDASSPFKADLAALSIASHPVDKIGNFVMDPLAMELIQRRSLQQCGRLGKK